MCMQNSILHTHDVLFALGRCILKPFWGHFPIYLGLGVYGLGTCLRSLQVMLPLLGEQRDLGILFVPTATSNTTPTRPG